MITRAAWLQATIVTVGLVFLGLAGANSFRDDFAIGWVPAEPVTVAGIGRIASTWTATGIRHLYLDVEQTAALSRGSWVVARGRARPVGTHQVLDVENVRVARFPLPHLAFADRDLAVGRSIARQHPMLSVSVASAMLLLGLLLVRVLGALMLGSLTAFLAWSGLAAAVIDGLGTISWRGQMFVLTLAFLGGMWLGFQRHSLPAYLAQRITAALAVSAVSFELTRVFGWPHSIAQAVGALVPLASPAFAICLLATVLLSWGLGLAGALAHASLAVACSVVHVLSRGHWLPEWHRMPSGQGPAGNAERPLHELVALPLKAWRPPQQTGGAQ